MTMLNASDLPKLIAFYLPQYHPIPENDAWWGKGFTEWTNVTRTTPQFRGHYQPHLPADLGFYDLRLSEVREAQADLARQYGIHGFCYYHYWFHGKRLLERPFSEVMQSGKPDFPFCLCWANESWSRVWSNQARKFLIEQTYSAEDDLDHIRWLCQAFQDQRYIRIDGKSLFLIYRPRHLPNPARTIEMWRNEAQRLGVGELFLCAVESNDQPVHQDPGVLGFDAAVEFLPNSRSMPSTARLNKIWRHSSSLLRSESSHLVINYDRFVDYILGLPEAEYKRFRCVIPSWDNSARRKKFALILHNSTPQTYQRWLQVTINKLQNTPPSERLVFINAWNEWAEGTHLEPDQKWGRSYLEATQAALQYFSRL